LSERAEDIINVASKFYNEILVELGEKVRREAIGKERRRAEGEEKRTEEQEKAGREARKKRELNFSPKPKRIQKKIIRGKVPQSTVTQILKNSYELYFTMERTKYPADLARAVHSEIKRNNAAPSLQVLISVFETMYFASIKTEEAEPVIFNMIGGYLDDEHIPINL